MHKTYRGDTLKIFLSFYALCRLTAAAAAVLQQHHAKTKNHDKMTTIFLFPDFLKEIFLCIKMNKSTEITKKILLEVIKKSF